MSDILDLVRVDGTGTVWVLMAVVDGMPIYWDT